MDATDRKWHNTRIVDLAYRLINILDRLRSIVGPPERYIAKIAQPANIKGNGMPSLVYWSVGI